MKKYLKCIEKNQNLLFFQRKNIARFKLNSISFLSFYNHVIEKKTSLKGNFTMRNKDKAVLQC